MTPPNEFEAALKAQSMQNDIDDLREHVKVLEDTVREMRKERDELMRWGLLTLGAGVVGMAMYIWNLLTAGRIK